MRAFDGKRQNASRKMRRAERRERHEPADPEKLWRELVAAWGFEPVGMVMCNCNLADIGNRTKPPKIFPVAMASDVAGAIHEIITMIVRGDRMPLMAVFGDVEAQDLFAATWGRLHLSAGRSAIQ